MPTLKEITDDLELIASKSQISDDLRIDDRWLSHNVHQYRAKAIRDSFKRNRHINPTWIQDQGNIKPTKVDADDDPAISGCGDCTFGKILIPTVVDLPDHMGVYRVSSACRTKSYYRTTLPRFQGFVNGSVRDNFNYFFAIGNAIYMHPYIVDASVQLILENPLEGDVLLTNNIESGDLVVGTGYEVTSGDITHNGTKYRKGDTFTATATTFTGNGKVQLQSKKRKLSNTDPYPIDHTLMEYVKMKILTQDLRIEENRPADIRNDSQDQSVRNE